jgi:hypothetical protein
MSLPKPWIPEPEHESGLEAAKEKLMGESEMTFDIEKILAEKRLEREHQAEHRKEAFEKLERELAEARVRGSRRRIRELEKQKVSYAKEQSHELDAVRRELDEEKKRLRAKVVPPIRMEEK